jgi:2-keto-4-pentenoate hydratase/2-oxohepta-3-ene-1,7-dioic acid hydratase in catechol pathway
VRLATILEDGRATLAAVRDDRFLVIAVPDGRLASMRAIAAAGEGGLARIREWLARRPGDDWRSLDEVRLGPAIPDPGAIYTIGLNYRAPGAPAGADPDTDPDPDRPERPLVYGKAASSVSGHGAVLTWDRRLTANVDAECELGVVIGREASGVAPADAMRHVFGYTIVNDVSSRDPWLDGDQWLVGKSMPGFCPIGPVVVTADELDPADLRLGCRVNGQPIQDGRTADLRFSIAEIVSYLSRHLVLRPGDLVATGTPARLPAPPGPDRHLQPGDVVTAWIEGIGELTTRIE